MDPFDMTGRVVLLTGAAGGIGAATARMCARFGAELVLSDRAIAPLEAVASDLREQGATVHALVCNLGDPASVRALVERATSAAGRVDVLICNGAMEGHVGPLGEAGDSAIDALFQVNLRSAMALTAGLVPAMAERGKGAVVLVASIAGVRGNKAIGLYGLAKAALAQLARNLAVEWGPSGVRVNTVSPGLTDTPFARPLMNNPDFLPRRLGLTPLRRPGEADEIAASILFLCSDAAGFITGHNLIADGGTTISDGN